LHNHIKEFSKQSNSYDSHTIVQKKVSSHLLSKINTTPQKILDLGCGTGEIYRKISWAYESLVAVDAAIKMYESHPKDKNVKVLHVDFESEDFLEYMQDYIPFDIIISSSALQWSKNIEKVFNFSAKNSNEVAFSIFTDKTFKDIYDLSGMDIFLPNSNDLIKTANKYFDISYEVKTYRIDFEDNISKFRYIKKSGATGGKKKLNITQMKNLIKNYPHKYLEFEVLFMWGKPLRFIF